MDKLFVMMTFVGIERALSGVRMFTVVPRLVCSVSGSACDWLANASIRPDESSFNVSRVNDDDNDDDNHLDRFRP